MGKSDLLRKKAKLESENDILFSELIYVDQLMRMVGFADGLKTVKLTAREIYEKEGCESYDEDLLE